LARDTLTHIRGILSDLFGHVEAYPLRALYFFTYTGTCIAGNFFLVSLRREGFSGREIAYVASMGPFMMFLAQPLWGVLADRFGRRRCLTVATFTTAVIYLRMYWVHSFWPIFLTAGAMALFSTPLAPLMDSVALDFVEERGNLSYGMFRVWGAIAAGVGTAGAGFLIEGHPTRTAFLWAMGALLTGTLFVATGKSPVPKHAVEKITFKGISPVIRNVPLMTFLVLVLFVAISSTAFWNFYGVYFTDIGGSSSLYGLAIAISAVAEIPFYFLSYGIIKRFGLQRALLFSFVCSTIRLFAYAFIGNPRVAMWIELSNGASWTLFWVAAVEHVNQLVKPEWRATGQSLLNASCWGAGAILGNLWNGFLLDYFRFHFINPWVPLAIQKVCFTSGLLLAALTVVSALFFKIVKEQKPVAACPATFTNNEEVVS
jgi:PPP family 3-phenylpropionic acid transporter